MWHRTWTWVEVESQPSSQEMEADPSYPGALLAEHRAHVAPPPHLSSRELLELPKPSTQVVKLGWILNIHFGVWWQPLKTSPAARAPGSFTPFVWLFNDSGAFGWSLLPGTSPWGKASGGWGFVQPHVSLQSPSWERERGASEGQVQLCLGSPSWREAAGFSSQGQSLVAVR